MTWLLPRAPRGSHRPWIGASRASAAGDELAVVFLDGIVADEPVAAVDLDGRRADALAHLGGEQLGHRRLLDAALAGLLELGGVQAHLARDLDVGRHLGQHEGDGLVLDQLRAERLALARVGERGIQRGARDAHGLRGHADTPGIEVGERDLQSLARRPQHVLGRNLEILECDLAGVVGAVAELVLDAQHAIARPVGPREEGRDAALAGGGIGDGEQHGHRRRATRRDERLAAVDHPALAAAHRARPQIRQVGAGLRLGEEQARQLLAAGHRAQVARLLLRRAVIAHLPAERVGGADHVADAGVAVRELLGAQHVRGEIGAAAAPLRRHAHAEESQGAGPAHGLERHGGRAIPRGGERRDLLADEVARRVADPALLVAEPPHAAEHSTGPVLPSAPHGPPDRRRRRRRVLARDGADRRACGGGHRPRGRRALLRRTHRRDGGGLARGRARRRRRGRRAARLQPSRRQPLGHDSRGHRYGPGAQRRARPLVRRRDRRRRQLRHAVRDRARAQARRAHRRAAHVAARAAGGAPRARAARPERGGRRAPRRRRRAPPRRAAGAHVAVVTGPVPIRVTAAAKRYGAVVALRGVSLDFPAGRLTAVLGPSGCGKTTLLRAIAGFLTLDEGRVRFGDDDVTALPPQARGTAMVFQSYALWPHMTVFDNVAYGLRLRRVAKPEIATRVREALALVEIGDVEAVARRKPLALSGGQQQRVALARALVVEPRVLLLDEPLSNLDAKVRQRLRVEIRRLQRRIGTTMIYVTHDQEEALAIADRVVLMNAGEVVQEGAPEEIYLEPASAFAADFLGVSNRLDAVAEPGRLRVGDQVLAYSGPLTGPVLVIARSADLTLDAVPEHGAVTTLKGILEESLFLGAHYRHYVRVGDAVLLVDGPAPAKPGAVEVKIPAGRLRVFPRSE